jgi:hypothetical protein
LSRKNLSRTVIEGGRRYFNSYSRRSSHGTARARTRDWLAHVAEDLDDAEGSDPRPARRVGKDFHDKLGPAQRWLDAQVGRPWNKVYSELRTKFDSRTLAGKHIVDDHMIGMVRQFDEPTRWHWAHRQLVVDRYGILRSPAQYRRSYNNLRSAAEMWAAKRQCTLTHRGWCWVRRVPLGAPCVVAFSPTCGHRDHHKIDGRWYTRMLFDDAGPMSPADLRRLRELLPEFRKKLVIANPWAR